MTIIITLFVSFILFLIWLSMVTAVHSLDKQMKVLVQHQSELLDDVARIAAAVEAMGGEAAQTRAAIVHLAWEVDSSIRAEA